MGVFGWKGMSLIFNNHFLLGRGSLSFPHCGLLPCALLEEFRFQINKRNGGDGLFIRASNFPLSVLEDFSHPPLLSVHSFLIKIFFSLSKKKSSIQNDLSTFCTPPFELHYQ